MDLLGKLFFHFLTLAVFLAANPIKTSPFFQSKKITLTMARAGLYKLSFPPHPPLHLTAEVCSLGLVAWKKLTACMAEELLGMSFVVEQALNGSAAFKTLSRTCAQPHLVSTELLLGGSSSRCSPTPRISSRPPSEMLS